MVLTTTLNLLSLDSDQKLHLADELIVLIFSHFQLPTAIEIGRDRYETAHVPDTGANIYHDDTAYYGANVIPDAEIRLRLSTLAALCKCSNRFRRLAEPLLYHTYPGQGVADPARFIHSLQARPQLAIHVKEMALDVWNSMHWGAIKELAPNGNASSWWEQQVKVRGLSDHLLSLIDRAAKKGHPDALVIQLLLYCSQLEVLDLASPFLMTSMLPPLIAELLQCRPNTWWRGGDQAFAAPQPVDGLPLRFLRELSVHFADANHIAGIQQLEPLCRLHTVQKFTCYRFTSEADFLTNMYNLQELCLWRCTFNEESLMAALTMCKPLKRLIIIWGGFKVSSGEMMRSDIHNNLSSYGKILRKHHAGIEVLKLDMRELIDANFNAKATLGSLAELTSLRELALPDFALMGGPYDNLGHKTDGPRTQLTDTLPTSLRKLSVFCQRSLTLAAATSSAIAYKAVDARECHIDEQQLSRLMACPRFSRLQEIHLDVMAPLEMSATECGWVADMKFRDPEVARPGAVVGTMGDKQAKRESVKMNEILQNVQTVRLRKLK